MLSVAVTIKLTLISSSNLLLSLASVPIIHMKSICDDDMIVALNRVVNEFE